MIDISLFKYAEDLTNDLEIILIIKGFNQLAITEKIIARKGDRSHGLTAIDNAALRKYSSGVIARLALSSSSITEQHLDSAIWRVDCLEPFDADICNSTFAFATGSEVQIGREMSDVRIIKYDWMSFIHTVEFSEDCSNILISSAGFDTIIECNLETGEAIWEWNAWDHGFNQSATEMKFITRRPKEASVFAKQYGENNVLYVRNPADLPAEGIATSLSPVRINGASYGMNNTILATCYHRPELFLIYRDGSFKTVDLELKHPHSFQQVRFNGKGRYWVTDSGHGRILILNDDFTIIESLDFTNLSADEMKRKTFGEWIQTSSLLHLVDRDISISVDTLRSGLHIVDITNKQRKFIKYPQDWTVQTVIPLMKDAS
jgi:hypothetical protein